MDLVPQNGGRDRLDQTVAAYKELGVGGGTAGVLIGRIGGFLDDGEHVVALCHAWRRDSVKGPVWLVLTPDDLVVVDLTTATVQERLSRSACRIREWRKDFAHGFRLSLTTPSGERTYKGPAPLDEGMRIAVAFGHPDPWQRDLLGDLPPDPGCPPIAFCWMLTLFPDRLVDHEARHLPFNGAVQATVDSAGNIAVTRGRNLAAKGVGTLMFGPVGLFMMGNAKHREVDTRELYLLVEGPGWAYTHPFIPETGGELRKFASLLNVTARSFLADSAEAQAPSPASQPDVIDQLERLAGLHGAGALTDAEFAAAKSKLLGL